MRIVSIKAAQTWPLRHRVMWPHKPMEFVKVPEDAHGLHYGLLLKDEEDPVAVVSLFVNDREAQFRKFCTDTNHQNKGYGSKLLNHVLGEAKKISNVERIWCNARSDKAPFYRKFGLKETDQVFERMGVNYVIMELFLQELEGSSHELN